MTSQFKIVCLAVMVALESVSVFSKSQNTLRAHLKSYWRKDHPMALRALSPVQISKNKKMGTWVNIKPIIIDGYSVFKITNFRPGVLTNGVDVASLINSLCKP